MSENEYVQLLEANHNLVLTGAPGTGKTYLAKEIAKAMGATEEKGNLKMVQFHPSYDYTDFVEGLRPKIDRDGFKRVDGVFKKFCKDANTDTCLKYLIESKTLLKTSGESPVEFMISEFNDKTIQIDTENNNHYTIGYSELIEARNSNKKIDSSWFENFLNTKPPLFEEQKNKLISHYYYSIYHEIWKPFVFIIDEINRGELSKIFGELFFSIDPGYRGKKGRVETQYQNLVKEDDLFKNGFYVPENVYIIGTMNDIDRSVESMDFAIRRRFAWCEVEASDRTEMLSDLTPELEEKAIKSMEKLNNTISSKEIGLTSAYHIGPAYYIKLKNYGGSDKEQFEYLWKYHIVGLLREYLRGTKGIEDKIKELKKAFDAYDKK